MTADEWTVARHLAAADDVARMLYERFVGLVDELGPTTCTVGKTAIVFAGSRRGFTGATLKKRALGGYFDLQRRLEVTGIDPRVRSVSPYTKRLFVHQFRVSEPAQLDDEFAGWLREAYEVGNGAHLRAPD